MSVRNAVAITIAGAALFTGCAAGGSPQDLPGSYREAGGSAEIRLEEGGAFVASGIPGSAVDDSLGDEAVDFSGTWEMVDSSSSRDFVYLSVDDGGTGDIAGIQLYVEGPETLSFIPDPDKGPSLTLER